GYHNRRSRKWVKRAYGNDDLPAKSVRHYRAPISRLTIRIDTRPSTTSRPNVTACTENSARRGTRRLAVKLLVLTRSRYPKISSGMSSFHLPLSRGSLRP